MSPLLPLVVESVTALWWRLVTLFTGVVGLLWGWVVAAFTRLWGTLPRWLASPVAGVFGILLAWTVFAGVLAVAVIRNLLGVDDVYGSFGRPTGEEGTEPDVIERIRDIEPGTVTDDTGRFSRTAFQNATGMTAAEFVHVFVRSNGGRIRQGTLNACLPWSKSTVTRLLDSLEREGALVRVTVGRENVVCTPEAVPDRG